MKAVDAAVIGGGAAGLMCAIEAGRRGRSVVVFERAEKIGKKILISGGGRCNFTNLACGSRNFISQNPHFCKSALAGYTPQDFIALVEKHGVAYHEKKQGQLFCDTSAQEIVRLLESECRASGAEIRTHCGDVKIAGSGPYAVSAQGEAIAAQSLVIATGGLSIPKMGATAFGYEIARQFGHALVPCRPGLVPFLWDKESARIYGELAGVSIDVEVSSGGRSFREAMLFTHKGLSGPAILQISNYCRPGNPFTINLLPDKTGLMDELVAARNKGADLVAHLGRILPKRFIQIWWKANVPAKPQSHLSGKDLKAILKKLCEWRVVPPQTEGYEKAEVTAGGVDTREISSKNMESLKQPGLYFVGEVLDVTGQLGGYNFQWAWSSGFAAGQTA